MPQAQPELKRVRRNQFHTYRKPGNGEIRRTRQRGSQENRKSKAEENKWTNLRLQYLDKRLFVQLNGSRKVFLNIVLDDAVEEKDGGEKIRLGMVVIRGNSVVMLEALERIGGGGGGGGGRGDDRG
ncbi:hypothetical protein B7494_g1529 [Chlorociboria aeruginascens]|nr:hypothetical protein B7494_g1529 [Chlorociboria aeruginascens]